MSESMELVEFLRARLDEDEHVAREAAKRAAAEVATVDHKRGAFEPPYTGFVWGNDHDHVLVIESRASGRRIAQIADCGYGAFGLTPHIALHDPARVLAEVEAKRRILTALDAATTESVGAAIGVDAQDGLVSGLHYAARQLAAAYADHPDYRAEWRAGEDPS